MTYADSRSSRALIQVVSVVFAFLAALRYFSRSASVTRKLIRAEEGSATGGRPRGRFGWCFSIRIFWHHK